MKANQIRNVVNQNQVTVTKALAALNYTFTHLWMAINFNSTKANVKSDGKFDEKVSPNLYSRHVTMYFLGLFLNGFPLRADCGLHCSVNIKASTTEVVWKLLLMYESLAFMKNSHEKIMQTTPNVRVSHQKDETTY